MLEGKKDIKAAIEAGLSPSRGDWRQYLGEAKKILERKTWSPPRLGSSSKLGQR